ncbi:hypothetical protein HK100_012511 [Physocladia obscura]|uniref:Thioredoxin domain-containing protein n=1 Tax=Physocladia obscura TaxID=109957 RepID=A0AAD5XHK5_9FUNG|nr:hypothetical protein HK100_012511 [Physocladia obscura]
MPTSVQLIDSQISLESKTLFEAIIKKSGPLVTKSIRTDPSLLNKFCDFDSTHGFKTPLLVAVELGFLPIIRLLYQLNADVSICTSITKQSVIHAAARTGQVQAIRFLIDHYHADAKHFIFEKDAKGQTPLLVAASSRSTDSGTCADIFLKLGANIADECPVLNGWSHQDSKIANKIPRLKKDQGKTEFVDALYLAQESKNDDAIRAILKRMKSVNIETVGAIIAHSPKNKNEKFKAIYSQLENPNKMADSKGRNLLMLALEKGNFLEYFRSPKEQKNATGKTEIGKFLLQQNISIHSVDNSGNTVLSYCACSSIASTLLMSGLRWDTPLNNAGQTPLEILEERGEDFQDVVELIALAKSVADGDSILEDNDDIASVLNQVMTNESLEETNITLQAHLEALQAQLSVLHPALIEESADLIGDLMKEIIGMDKLKNDLRSWLRTQQVDKARRRQGIHIGEPHMPHTVLLGNPGTGKTTVARIIAKALSKIGITNNKFAELTRDQLVGGYIGQTEKQMQELFKTYAGGVLFIDEAYRLVGGGVDYGRIALESMMTQMTTKNNDIVFIFAGYPNEMKAFMNVNPGLSRRIDQTFNFEDYSPEELTKIVEVTGISRGFKFEPEAIAKLPHLIFYGFDPSVRAKFNGGLADRLFTLAKEQIDLRTMDENLNNVDTLMTITEPDVRNAIPRLVDLISGNDDGVFEGPVREITGIDEFNKVILTPGIVVGKQSVYIMFVDLIYVDADNVPETKQMAAINAYPTFQWFKNGKKIQELVGADVKKLKSFTERCSKSMADSQNPLSDESPVANSVVKAPERTVEEPLVEEEKIIEVFDVEQFDNLVASEDTLVVDFHAVWCQSCKAATPEFEKLSKKFTNLKFAKVDADDTNIAKIKKVNDFPYFKFYKAGQIKGELLVEHDVEDFAKLRQMTERFDLEETPVAVPSCSIKRPDEPQISTASETKVAAPPPKTVTKQESAETEEKKGEEEEEEEGGDDSGESDENKALYSKLKQISNCPAGYVWNRCEGGYRCAGGSHFVTNEELDKFFTV